MTRGTDLVAFMRLFAEFRASSWDAWRTILAQLTANVREFYAIAGRGSGKSRIAALLAAYFVTRSYQRVPGESIYIGVFAPDRAQAAVTFRYVRGLLGSVPELAALIVAETRDSVTLSSGVVVEVITARTAAPRGRAYALAILEEAAFLSPDEHSANPDLELLRALRPGLARVPGALLVVISSPYARRGILYDAWQRPPRPDLLVVRAGTRELNPSFDADAIARAFEDDPIGAATEYDAAFRSDVETFLSRDALTAAVIGDRYELPRVQRTSYVAFTDPAGGSGADAFTLAIAHRSDDRAVLDAIREVRPPFSPEATVAEFAAVLQSYGLKEVEGDRYAGTWPAESFQRHGIRYVVAEQVKSDIYRSLLPIVMSGRVELLDHARLLAQFAGLERRTARGGRDSIDHAPRQHDDLANAAAGAIVAAARRPARGASMFHAFTGRPIDPAEFDPFPFWR
jgi:hypothetical protein